MFHGMTTTNNFTDKISNEEAAALPAIEFRGEIRIVDNERDIVPACKFLMKQRVIGFDTETRPSFDSPPMGHRGEEPAQTLGHRAGAARIEGSAAE